MSSPLRPFGKILTEAWESGYFLKASEVAHLSDEERTQAVRAALDGSARQSAEAKNAYIEKWTDNRPARLYFRQPSPQTAEERQLLEDIENAIDIVERHYVKIDTTPNDPLQLVKVNVATNTEPGGLDPARWPSPDGHR